MASDWLDLALYRLGLRQGPTKSWEYRRTDMMSLSDASLFDQWELPNQVSAHELLECFFQGPNLIFPLLEWKECMTGLEQCLNSGFFEFGQRNGPSQILQLLAVLILGYISGPHQIPSFNARCYLNRCRTMLGHVIKYPSIATLKSLILFSLALKSSNELLEAWHTVNLAASIATSLGLNQQTTLSQERTSLKCPAAQEKTRLWIYVYTIEKLLAFELGRHSNLQDIQEAELPDTLGCKELFELARLLSGIGKRSVHASRQEDETDQDDELYRSICEKVKITGESCIKLIQWAESMPDELRPTSDSIYNSRLHPVASYISMQYHSAIIILSRNSLLISKEALQSAVGVIAKDKPWYSVIRNGQSMVADAARKTLRLVIEGVDSDFNAALSSLTAPLNSLATLVVLIVTRPRSHVAGTDLSLIETAASALRELHYWSFRGNNDLGSLLDRLVKLASDSVKAARHSRAAGSSISASEGRAPLFGRRGQMDQTRPLV
uniref:Xylanolytic transcriptional activator regulatory domain-containing protein n=1 Tax=Bionectria ochroleuca TaxID=29856 RepID=A0A0B7KBY8_BIOOC